MNAGGIFLVLGREGVVGQAISMSMPHSSAPSLTPIVDHVPNSLITNQGQQPRIKAKVKKNDS